MDKSSSSTQAPSSLLDKPSGSGSFGEWLQPLEKRAKKLAEDVPNGESELDPETKYIFSLFYEIYPDENGVVNWNEPRPKDKIIPPTKKKFFEEQKPVQQIEQPEQSKKKLMQEPQPMKVRPKGKMIPPTKNFFFEKQKPAQQINQPEQSKKILMQELQPIKKQPPRIVKSNQDQDERLKRYPKRSVPKVDYDENPERLFRCYRREM